MPQPESPEDIRERLARLDRIMALAGVDPSKPFEAEDVARVHELLEAARRAHRQPVAAVPR